MDQAEKGITTGLGSHSRTFPRLHVDASTSRALARVCIVTPEIVGPTRNGGIGTAYTSLALELARAGHEVTVLFTGDKADSGTLRDWENFYTGKGLLLTPLKRSGRRMSGRPYYRESSYEVFAWLKDHQSTFDIVHFPEWQGLGYYSLLAKHQGIAFPDITFCVGTHSSTAWLEAANNRAISYLEQITADFMERESVRLADIVLSPSQYLLEWMLADGWTLPAAVFVSPYVVPDSFLASAPIENTEETGADRKKLQEIVFFGRLEIRKGLILFCDAVDLLLRSNPAIVPRITFLGRSLVIRDEDSADYAHRRAERWGVEVSILSKDHDDALDYICGDGVLAIVPSLIENFPCTVLECLARRVPFLASAVGGIPEQIAVRDRERVCFPPRPDALAAKMEHALREPPAPASPAFDFVENNQLTVRWHEALVATAKRNREVKQVGRPATAGDTHPLVSVCLVHHDRPVFLRQSLESLLTTVAARPKRSPISTASSPSSANADGGSFAAKIDTLGRREITLRGIVVASICFSWMTTITRARMN